MNIREIANKPQRLVPGHRTCAGCGIPQIIRTILASTDKPVVVACATGCLEVTTTIYPYSSWNVPFIHSAFENAASTISGVETAYRALLKKGKIKDDIKFIAFGGDGGTSDIGLQALSGALERGHNFLYVQYDNEAYMNTGVQRSSATPFGANTTTSPVGKVIKGKIVFRKDLTKIVAAHNIPYVAQACLSHLVDLANKAQKAINTKGPTFINVLQPCTLGWKFAPCSTIKIAKLAVKSNFWPLYEVENGKYKLNYKNENPIPIIEFIKYQKRYKHLLKPENKHLLDKLQEHVNKEWEKLLKLCGEK